MGVKMRNPIMLFNRILPILTAGAILMSTSATPAAGVPIHPIRPPARHVAIAHGTLANRHLPERWR